MLRMMLRPRWLAALVLALAIAAAFALLGQWQMESAIEAGAIEELPSEEPMALTAIAQPDGPTDQAVTGQTVDVEGTWVPGHTVLIEGRLNDGVTGYWVVAHLAVAQTGAGLPIALGWSAGEDDARAVAARFDASAGDEPVELQGRFLPSEAPVTPETGEDPQRMTTVAIAHLINVWEDFDNQPVYFGYVVAFDPPAGLDAIDSPPPEQILELNWLNIFYAVEWVVFAGFAIYLWYRLVRDAVERERAERDEESASPSDGAGVSTEAP